MPYKDPEAKRAYDVNYYAAHREKKAAYQTVYQTAYYTAHREKIAAYAAAYAKANPETYANYSATRRARKADAFIEAIDRQVVFVRDQGTCGICQQGVESANWHLDHVLPLSKGGMHSYDNVQVSHPVCNMRKGSKI